MSDAAESVDAMLEQAMAPEATPEATQEGQVSEQPQLEVVEESPKVEETDASYTIKYKGKDIGLEDPKYRDFAQKGYDYEQKMHKFRVDSKLKEQEWAKKQEQFKELEAINDYAKQNPEFEALIQQEWAKVQAGQPRETNPQTEVQVLRSQVNQLLEKFNSQEEQLNTRRVAEMEAAQEGAISTYKEEHSDFDWVKKDDNGQTLEDRIGQAMIDNEVKNFNIMADSFLKKELITRKTLEGKEAAAKDIQKVNKLGLGKVTKKSQLGVKKAEDIGNKSYDDLIKEGLSEFGIDY